MIVRGGEHAADREAGLQLEDARCGLLRGITTAAPRLSRRQQHVRVAPIGIGLEDLARPLGRLLVLAALEMADADGEAHAEAHWIEGAKAERPVAPLDGARSIAADRHHDAAEAVGEGAGRADR